MGISKRETIAYSGCLELAGANSVIEQDRKFCVCSSLGLWKPEEYPGDTEDVGTDEEEGTLRKLSLRSALVALHESERRWRTFAFQSQAMGESMRGRRMLLRTETREERRRVNFKSSF